MSSTNNIMSSRIKQKNPSKLQLLLCHQPVQLLYNQLINHITYRFFRLTIAYHSNGQFQLTFRGNSQAMQKAKKIMQKFLVKLDKFEKSRGPKDFKHFAEQFSPFYDVWKEISLSKGRKKEERKKREKKWPIPSELIKMILLKVVNEAQQRKEKSEPKVTDLLAFRLLNKQWKALVDKMLKKGFKRDCLDFMVVPSTSSLFVKLNNTLLKPITNPAPVYLPISIEFLQQHLKLINTEHLVEICLHFCSSNNEKIDGKEGQKKETWENWEKNSQLFSQLAQLVLPCDRFVPPDPCILNATDYQRTFGLSFIKAELKRGEEGKRVVESNCYYK